MITKSHGASLDTVVLLIGALATASCGSSGGDSPAVTSCAADASCVSLDASTSDASHEASATVRDSAATQDDAGVACSAGATRKCKDDPSTGALGSCGEGVETCVAGQWGACSVQPAAMDSCTPGDDANCNGAANEGCPCVDGATQPCGPTAEIGICKKGAQTCTGATWGGCMGATFAKARDCTSALDNDCDGTPDDAKDTVCQCAAGAMQSCQEHPGHDGKGLCVAGTQSCVMAADHKTSAWGACSGAVAPAAADTCDPGNDANCSGTANDSCLCINGINQACSTVVCGGQACAAGVLGTCTGPTLDTGEVKWPMPNPASMAGAVNLAQYDTTTLGIVVDKITGLVWQLSVPTTGGDDTHGRYQWANAPAHCQALSLGGYATGWRVPTELELFSLVDDTQSPTTINAAFAGAPADFYWSSTQKADSPTDAWTVYFGGGYTNSSAIVNPNAVRCVH